MSRHLCSHGFDIEMPCEHCVHDALARIPEAQPVATHGKAIYNTAIDHALSKLRTVKTLGEAVAAIKGLKR